MEPLRVLVVDDEAGMRHGITRALRDFALTLPDFEEPIRFATETADSGEAALERLAGETYDLILLDHKLGGMTGVEVLEQLQSKSLDLLVIMITAFATIETAVRATKDGAFDFLPKPFTPAELRETLRKAALHLLTQRRAKQLAEEKRRVRFDFISVLGHELKAPLAAIENYLKLMQQRVAGDTLEAYGQAIERSLARAGGMRKLIADLLDMTRIESGQKRRELTVVDVEQVARTAIETVQEQARQRGITIELTTTGDCTLPADRSELEIVLTNLVSNAVKYNRDDGRVDVTLAGTDESLQLSVRDTGIGISDQERQKLFTEFGRIRNDRTRQIEGSGLGLSTVKKIAELYAGRVEVSSTPDVGSTFRVTLTRAAAPPPEPAAAGTGMTA